MKSTKQEVCVKKLKYLRIFLSFFVFLVFSLILAVFFLFLFLSYPEKVEENNEIFTSKQNLFKESSSKKERISDVSLLDDKITKFGKSEFRCYGRCSCEDERRSSTTAVRGVKYIVAAVSSILAVKIARDHFEKECVEELKDSCSSPSSSVISEVDDCVEKDSDAEKKKEEEYRVTEVAVEVKKKKKAPRGAKYLCRGKCLMSWADHKETSYRGKLYWDNYSFWQRLRWVFRSSKHNRKCHLMVFESIVRGKSEEAAVKEFARRHLDTFCRSNSVEVFTNKMGEDYRRSMCVAYFSDENIYLDADADCRNMNL